MVESVLTLVLELLGEMPAPQYSIPVLSVVVGGILAMMFALPLWLGLAVSGLPSVLQFIDSPYSNFLTQYHPLVLTVAGWFVLIGFGVGNLIVSSLVSVFGERKGFVAFIASCFTGVALCAAVILCVAPGAVSKYVPGWQDGVSVGIACFATIAFAAAFLRAMRAGVAIICWGAIAAVLVIEVWGPSAGLENLEALLGTEVAESGSFVRVAQVGVSASPESVEEALNREFGTGKKYKVREFGPKGIEGDELRRLVRTTILPAKPDLVVLSANQSVNEEQLTGVVAEIERSGVQSVVIDFSKEVESRPYDILYLAENLLSSHGREVLVGSITSAIRKIRNEA